MNIHDLRSYQAKYENERQDLAKSIVQVEKDRLDFIKRFSLQNIVNLTMDDYVVGNQNKNGFCYGLETKLMGLGKIKGGSTADKKFGLYFGRTKTDPTKKYRFLIKFGHSEQEAFDNIKSSIINLIKAGELEDIEQIHKNKLSPMFKGKILSTYFPDVYLNVFSNDHLDYFIESLELDTEWTNKAEVKRKALVDFKNSDVVMKSWSMYEFSVFLYSTFGTPWNQKEVISELKPYIIPPIENVVPEFIELSINDIIDEQKKTSLIHKPYKPDYEKKNETSRQLGFRGEKLVFQEEKKFLQSNKKADLAERTEHVSIMDDSLGYDILSYELDGSKKYIEVKSTSHSYDGYSFTMTKNEIETAKQSDNYYLYLVFKANSLNPQIFVIKHPFSLSESKIKLTPTQFRVSLNLS